MLWESPSLSPFSLSSLLFLCSWAVLLFHFACNSYHLHLNSCYRIECHRYLLIYTPLFPTRFSVRSTLSMQWIKKWSKWWKLSEGIKVNLEKLFCSRSLDLLSSFLEKANWISKSLDLMNGNIHTPFSFDLKSLGPTGIRTQVARFKVWSDNHYTMEPFFVCSSWIIVFIAHICGATFLLFSAFLLLND